MNRKIKSQWIVVGMFLTGLVPGFSQVAVDEVSGPSTAARPSPPEDNFDHSCVRGNGLSVRLNHGRIQTSADNFTWHECPLTVATFLRGLTFGNGLFVAVGGSYIDAPGAIFTSRDGVHWIRRHVLNTINLYGVAHGNGRFVAVGDDGTVFTSTDGVAWKHRRSRTTASLAAVAFGKGLFVAGGDSGAVLVSTNGVHWVGGSLGTSVYVGRIHFRDGIFEATSCDGTFTSTNAITWHRSALQTPDTSLTRFPSSRIGRR